MSTSWLKKIAVKVEKKQDSLFGYPVKKQEAYIKRFREPKDEFERSYFQYCCQMKLYGPVLHFFLNLAALPLTAALLYKYRRSTVQPAEKAECIFFRNGMPQSVLPRSLTERYPHVTDVTSGESCLQKSDTAFLKEVFKRYPFSWMLWLKTTIKIAQYSAAIAKYSPDAILSCEEYSFASSIITKYCRMKNIRRINVMHGEKLFFMRDSFVCFDAYYVWDQVYADLLISMGAEKSQFVVEAPPSVMIEPDPSVEKEYDYTYYLQNETEEDLRLLSKRLRILKDKGNRISIRPHPRYTNRETARQIFDGMNLENGEEVSIETSILRTSNVISKYSSVLNQAYHSGVNIIIDDISDRERYEKLVELRFVLLSVKHELLSEILEG